MELFHIFTILLLTWSVEINAQLFSDFFQGLQFGQTQGFTLAPLTGFNTRKPAKSTRKQTTSLSSHQTQPKRTKTTIANAYTTQKAHRKTIKTTNKRVVTQNWNNQNYNNVEYQTAKPKNKNRNDAITFTTQNPFYNHPGVKPANVDQNQPPITNKPVRLTSRPSHYTERPVIRPNRPNFDTNQPTYNDGTNYDTRPIYTERPSYNDKPTYNTERPTYNNERPTYTQETPNYNINRPGSVRPNEADGIAFIDNGEGPPLTAGVDEDAMSSAEKKRHLDIAEQMCNKYKSMTTSHIQAIPLIPSPEPVNVNVSKCIPVNIPLIVGGKVVGIKEFPHMALVGWNSIQGGYSWKCGGSLISDRFVLTVAHCAYQERDDTVVTGTPRAVQLGSSYLNDPRALVVKVAAVIRHPKYKLPKSYYDLALLKLAKTIKFTDTIRPACLGSPPRTGTKIIATGWGKTSTAGDQSLELRSVALPVWELSECARVLGVTRKLPRGVDAASQLCAGDARGGRDTCQGDSGGPAQIQDGCLWRVAAVTSLGRSCGAPDTPGLYAKVMIPFISAHAFEGVKLENKPNKPNYDSQTIYYDYNNRNNNEGNNFNSNNNQGSYNNNNQNSYTNNNNQSADSNFNNQDNSYSANNNKNSFSNNNQDSISNHDYNNQRRVNYETDSSYNQNFNDRNNRRTEESYNNGYSNIRNDYGRSNNEFSYNPYNQEEQDRNTWWT